MLPAAFETFVRQCPVSVMARAILERFLEPERLDELFRRTATQQYERELLFSALVELMHAVVLGVEPSVLAAFRKRQRQLTVSDDSIYNKLKGLEPQVSAALVRDSAQRAAALVDELGARQTPWLEGYRVRVLDGNHLSATEHRLQPLRKTWAAPLPGKILVVLDPELGVACDAFLTPDGHAQERTLLDEVLPTVQAGELWLADRNFCTLQVLFTIAERKAAFVIRQQGQLKGRLVGKRRFVGDSATGQVYEQAVEVTHAGQKRKLRRITVELHQPTRDGARVIHVLTNLPEDVSALQVAELYRQRWSIETLFYEITQTLACEVQTLCYPPAALFVFCLALQAANAVAVLKAALRATHGAETAATLSSYYLALEIKQMHAGMLVALPPAQWAVFRQLSMAAFAAQLRRIAEHLDLAYYRKSPRGPKKKPPKKTRYQNGGHVSTYKLLQKAKAKTKKP